MRTRILIAFSLAFASPALADDFVWTVDTQASVLTTTLSATLGATLSDSETNRVSGFIAGSLALPSYTFGSIHLTSADLAYTTNPSFRLAQPFVGGVTIVGNALGFALPGANNLGFASPTSAAVDLAGGFTQPGNGAEGRGTLTYTGVGILGSSIGTGTINLRDQSPLPLDLAGTIAQTGNQLRLTLPISLDQTTIQNGIPVRVQVSGNVIANAPTTANGWKADVDGIWGTQSNWIATTGTPGASGQTTFDTAVFGNFGNGALREISVTSPISPRRVIVDTGATGRYRFSGTSTLTLSSAGGASITALKGTAQFDLPVALPAVSTVHTEVDGQVRLSNVTSAAASTLIKTGVGQLSVINGDLGVLNVDAGVVRFSGASYAARVHSLTIAPTATVAVSEGIVIETQVGGAAALSGLLAGGRITQPVAGRMGFATAAAAGQSSAGGFTLSATSLLLRATIAGDTNLDRSVNFDDLLTLAQGYGLAGFWYDGDFTYDGVVNFDDLLLLAQNYGQGLSVAETAVLSQTLVSDFALARSLVPEPSLAIISLAGLASRRRRY